MDWYLAIIWVTFGGCWIYGMAALMGGGVPAKKGVFGSEEVEER
jgi:hypothetical protein